MHSKNRHQLRRTLDTLKPWMPPPSSCVGVAHLRRTRSVSAPTPVSAVVSPRRPVAAVRAQSSLLMDIAINNQMVAFIESRMDQRFGGGECADLAVEALPRPAASSPG